MAPDRIELLQHVYDHWGRGDWSPRFSFYADEFEWGWSAEFPDLHGVFCDTETPNSRLQAWLDPWELWSCEAERYVEAGEDVVVVLARYRGRGKGSGATVDVEGAHLWRIRDGRAVRLEIFADRPTALAAAGLA